MPLQTRRQTTYLENAGISFRNILLKYEEKQWWKEEQVEHMKKT